MRKLTFDEVVELFMQEFDTLHLSWFHVEQTEEIHVTISKSLRFRLPEKCSFAIIGVENYDYNPKIILKLKN